ncbi:winged helix-turn-helix domain-containing protein [Rhodoligotrophos defluvii]|uniref:winged helix-turn-helix transcriptional regulator n=1 Tax=Rhodoligotrophos defluvii TaxID=2561934 RepID=UPI0010C976E7
MPTRSTRLSRRCAISPALISRRPDTRIRQGRGAAALSFRGPRTPRTQAELQDALGMSSSGVLHLLRRMERDGLVRPAERFAWTRIWERTITSATGRRS